MGLLIQKEKKRKERKSCRRAKPTLCLGQAWIHSRSCYFFYCTRDLLGSSAPFLINAEAVGSATKLSQRLVCKAFGQVAVACGVAHTIDAGQEESRAADVGTGQNKLYWGVLLRLEGLYVSVKSTSKSSALPSSVTWRVDGVRAIINCTYFSFSRAAKWGEKKQRKTKHKKISVAAQATHAFHNVSCQCVATIMIKISVKISFPIIGRQTISLLQATAPKSLSEEAVTMATGGI